MKTERVYSAQNFSGLNIKRVAKAHKQFLNADSEKLKELSEKYDISMRSYINSDEHCDGISITVKNLRKNLNSLQKLIRPKGTSYFYTTPHYTADTINATFTGQIQKAITDLENNTLRIKKTGVIRGLIKQIFEG